MLKGRTLMFENPSDLSWCSGNCYQREIRHENVLKTIQDCEAMCEHMMTFLKRRSDVQTRVRQLQLLHDCADICTLTAKYVARHSAFSKHTAHLCGQICEICGNECAKFSDEESQECSRICLNCARECRAFAGR